MSYGSFNASEFQPSNGGGAMHPPGIFVGTISNAEIKPTNDAKSGYYAVTMKSNAGEITMRYNLWNTGDNAEKTIAIARQQLSALCHAINYLHLNFDTSGGGELKGAPLMFEVGPQMVNDPEDARKPKQPSPTLTEVKRVFSQSGINPARPSDPPVVPTEGNPAPAATQAPASPSQGFTPPASAPAPAPAPTSAASPPAPAWQQPAAPAAGATAKPPWER